MDKLTALKTRETDRQKVELWLNSIQEFDPACRAEVLLACKNDLTARSYYLKRYEADCALQVG